MIKLFITDLDGCISHPFTTPHWPSINAIRELNLQSRTADHVPPLSICTGRPFPYAEAVAQWLDVKLPFVFESAGVYHWKGNRVETAFDNKPGALDAVESIRRWLADSVLPDYPNAQLEFTKLMDAGIVCPDTDIVNEIYDRILRRIDEKGLELEVHTTDISVNVLLKGNNKLAGIRMIAGHAGVGLHEVAYIGDTSGDVVALKEVKMPFAPINARDVAKENADVLQQETTKAVLEAYKRVIDYNMNLINEGQKHSPPV
ncbi:MAG: HAD hydrolase family protein [Balneolaceae bacterium]